MDKENYLFYGDNLEVLRLHIKDDSVDLVYLDPPFKSTQSYNILFEERNGRRSTAQLKAFEDSWYWDKSAAESYQETVEKGGLVSQAMQAFRKLLGLNDMLAYLSMMAPRLIELRRVLKQTGSIYLHCDPTANHYLKMLLDSIFGPDKFRNEIVWRRTGAHNKTNRWGPIHDVLLFYTKSNNFTWNQPRRPYMKGHVDQHFIKDGEQHRTNYYGNVLTGSGTRRGESGKPWRNFNPTEKGRHWAIPRALLEDIDFDVSALSQHEKLDLLFKLGYIKIVNGQSWPIYERYISSSDGPCAGDIWAYQPYTEYTVFGTDEGIDSDVSWLKPRDKERLGYPTQKPVGLLKRILMASSNPGDVVLDPFCGCGTTIQAAEELNRKWIGIDITSAAITLIKNRLNDVFGQKINYKVIGEPVTLSEAKELVEQDRDPYQFEWWALGLVGARPVDEQRKKGPDKGIDGRIYFHDEPAGGKTKQILFSVKSGKVSVKDIRDLRGVVEREKAEIGVLITLRNPTRPMKTEAAGSGFYESPWGKHSKMQIITIEQLLEGKKVDYPAQTNVTYKKAPKNMNENNNTKELL